MVELNIQDLIGIVAMPFIIPLLVSDIRGFCQGIPFGPKGTGSPWPLIRDLISVGWVTGLWHSDQLPLAQGLPWPAIVLLGLAIGVTIGAGYDFTTKRGIVKPTEGG